MNKEITDVIKAYEKSLNTSDAKAASDLFGSDPVYMPENSPALTGREAVRARYERVFKTLRFKVAFTIQEIAEMGDLAFARTSTDGQREVLATHEMSKAETNDLFIFRKEQGEWKIHRFIFASSITAVSS